MFNRVTAFSRQWEPAFESPGYTPLHLVDVLHYEDVAIV